MPNYHIWASHRTSELCCWLSECGKTESIANGCKDVHGGGHMCQHRGMDAHLSQRTCKIFAYLSTNGVAFSSLSPLLPALCTLFSQINGTLAGKNGYCMALPSLSGRGVVVVWQSCLRTNKRDHILPKPL